MEGESKYTVSALGTGFVVSGPNRVPTMVFRRPYTLEVQSEDWPEEHYGFYEYYLLSRAIARRLMSNWIPPERAHRSPHGFPGMRR